MLKSFNLYITNFITDFISYKNNPNLVSHKNILLALENTYQNFNSPIEANIWFFNEVLNYLHKQIDKENPLEVLLEKLIQESNLLNNLKNLPKEEIIKLCFNENHNIANFFQSIH
jgi:hypothetical protein